MAQMTRGILIAINKPKRMQGPYLARVRMRDTPLETKEVDDSPCDIPEKHGCVCFLFSQFYESLQQTLTAEIKPYWS